MYLKELFYFLMFYHCKYQFFVFQLQLAVFFIVKCVLTLKWVLCKFLFSWIGDSSSVPCSGLFPRELANARLIFVIRCAMCLNFGRIP